MHLWNEIGALNFYNLVCHIFQSAIKFPVFSSIFEFLERLLELGTCNAYKLKTSKDKIMKLILIMGLAFGASLVAVDAHTKNLATIPTSTLKYSPPSLSGEEEK